MDIVERLRYDSDLRKFSLNGFNEKLSELGQDACKMRHICVTFFFRLRSVDLWSKSHTVH
jgi:hypothetical protein